MTGDLPQLGEQGLPAFIVIVDDQRRGDGFKLISRNRWLSRTIFVSRSNTTALSPVTIGQSCINSS
ncbi:hypothetical protein CQA86_28960, partial [Klebsiella pneumoniae]